MADFRSIQTRIWREDEWFVKLEVDARLFWIYLFSNPSASPCGMYRLPVKTMAFETGIDERRIEQLLAEFADKQKAYYDDGVVWVVNMRRLQFPDLDGSGAWQTATRMAKDIDAIPDKSRLKHLYLEQIGYPLVEESTVTTSGTVRTVRKVRIVKGSGIVTVQPLPAPAAQLDEEAVREYCVMYENIMGAMPTSILPDVTSYLNRLAAGHVLAWWLLALQETVGAPRPTWQYMKGVLEKWLAAGEPSSKESTNGGQRGIGITGRSKGVVRPRQAATPADTDAIADAIARAAG